MSLQFIIGGTGSDKTETIQDMVIRRSIQAPDKNYYMIVPEQYTMQTQAQMAGRHPGGGVMNIDIVSFPRLAYRVFDEVGNPLKTVLEDSGKRMVIRRILTENRQHFDIFGGNIKKSGFIGEAKSMISELIQYQIRPEDLEQCSQSAGKETAFGKKLSDIRKLYEGFLDYLSDSFMTAEEILDVLSDHVDDSEKLRDSEIYLDNFTGFTPTQYHLMERLLRICSRVVISLTIDIRDRVQDPGKDYELFHLTKETLWKLEEMCRECHIEREEDMMLPSSKKGELACLEKGIFRFGRRQVWDREPEQIHIHMLESPEEEVGFTARTILGMVRQEGWSFRDFAVITSDVSRYEAEVERQFEQLDIPVFIDQKRNLMANSFIEALRSGMDTQLWDYSYESVMRYLRSGYSQVAEGDADVLENYLLATGVRGYSRWSKPFVRRGRRFQGDMFLEVNRIREEVLQELAPLREGMQQGQTVRDHCVALYRFMENIQAEEQIKHYMLRFEEEGRLDLVREYEQIYTSVIRLLEKCVDILGDTRMTLEEFAEVLDAGFEEEQVGVIPPTLDQVVFGDLKRTRLGRVRFTFLMGCNDGVLPSVVNSGGMISDREKEQLAEYGLLLAPTGRENSFREYFYIYSHMTQPSEGLFMTFAQMDGSGKALNPSPVLREVKGLFPALKIKAPNKEHLSSLANVRDGGDYLLNGFEGIREGKEPDPLWQTLYAWFSRHDGTREQLSEWLTKAFAPVMPETLSAKVVRALYGEHPLVSITTLEKYAACAYAHFLQAGLGLRERERYRLSAPDMGTILHGALEYFSEALTREGKSWKQLENEERDGLAEKCVRKAAEDFRGTMLLDNARYKYYIEKMVRLVKRTVWTIQKQIEKGDFEPAGFELDFSEKKLLHLVGKIDRYDIYENDDKVAVRIIDYKSGSTSFDLTSVYYGLQIQLVVYMKAIARMTREKYPEKEVVEAGLFYYHISDPMLLNPGEDESAQEEALLSALKMDGLVNSDPQVLRWMDRELENKPQILPVTIKKDGSVKEKEHAADSSQLEQLNYLMERRIRQFSDHLMSGDISVDPYLRQKGSVRKTACDFCDYQGVCQFDTKLEGCDYHRLMEIQAERVWQKIYEEVREECQ